MLSQLRSRITYGNVVATLALFIALGGTTYAATGGNFILGKSNSASSTTSLTAPVAAKGLQVTNTSTGAGATALGLNVASGHAPFTVNSGAKVANLNADKLDGLDSSVFFPSSDVKPLVFNPGHVCVNAGDAGCSTTFSLGGLSLAAKCFSSNGGADSNLEIDNTSATNQVGYAYVAATSTPAANQGVGPPSSSIFDLNQSPGPALEAQGTLIDLAAAKPETANFFGSSEISPTGAVCQLWLVGMKPH
jgi:hypothetical protein